jgi:hypothetical protein
LAETGVQSGAGDGDVQGNVGEAVSMTMKIESDMTVDHIELIYLPYEKAELLTEAASVLADSTRPTSQGAPAGKR